MSTTCVLPFQPDSMATAQLAAVSYLARYSGATRVTVAPITSTIRGLSTEVPVGTANGLEHASVVSCDNIDTVPVHALGRHLGFLLAEQETGLTEAIRAAFDLE